MFINLLISKFSEYILILHKSCNYFIKELIEFPLFTKIKPSENVKSDDKTFELKILFIESNPGKSINSIFSLISSDNSIKLYASIGTVNKKNDLL